MSKASNRSDNPGHRWKKGESGNPDRCWKTGESGNPNGRPKGPRRNLSDAFLEDFLEAWRTCGKHVIADAMAKYPDVLLHVASSLVPDEERARIKPSIDDEMLRAARLLAAKSEVNAAAARARESRGETPAPVDSEGNRLASYMPYAKQMDFHAAGAKYGERLLSAGNQLGKTLAGGMEWAMHLTGRYPDWWKGRVFNSPVRMWASGVTVESTRDNPQRILIGTPQQRERWGTGTIPMDVLKDWTLSQAVGDAIDSIVVRWGGGGDVQQGASVLAFKSYEKGREKWQGETLDGVWFDEEPPIDIYSEGRTRCIARNGTVIVTSTPLKGMTELVRLFLSDADLEKLHRAAG